MARIRKRFFSIDRTTLASRRFYIISKLVRIVSVIGLIAATAACASDNGRQIHTAAFQCGDTRAEARFLDGSLELSVDDEIYVLVRVRAASGAKYETRQGDGRVLFWNKGEKARLEIGGQTYPQCRESAPPHASVSLPFKASGNEPAWSLAYWMRWLFSRIYPSTT